MAWRVFQILLEYACKTDYKLITRKMEELHRKNEEELQAKNAKLTLDYIEKDAELQAKMFRIQQARVQRNGSTKSSFRNRANESV